MENNNANNNAARKRALLIAILLLLIICVAVTATILFFRLSDFSEGGKDSVIDIVPTGDPDPAPTDDDSDDETVPGTTANTDPMATADPSFIAYDDNVVWSTNTEVEIFRISYEDGEANITVNSANGDKVIAPGTENEYTFYLKNTGNIPVVYTVWMEAEFSKEDAPIPVEVKVNDFGGRYYIGTESLWEDVLRLNEFKQSGELSVNNYASYTLNWQWLFENGMDEYDTYLGNLAGEEDVTLIIKIHTVASADADAMGGMPTTGDETPVTLLWVVLALSSGLLILVLFLGRKKKPDEENSADH